MNRSPKNPIDHRQLSSRSDNNKTLSELVMKTPNSIRSRQSPTMKLDQSDDSHDNDSDDDQVTSNQTLSKFIRNQPTNPSRTRSPSAVSLKSVVIDGQWKYRGDGDDNDKLRLQSKGIENLITICHDIMQTTLQSIREKKENRKKPSSSAPIDSLFSIVKLDAYKQITNPERASLQRAKVYNLMTIVYEAAATSASISQLVRIWREATEHNLNPSRRKKPVALPKLSYEIAFQHLIRKPDNQLLQIGLHASLISSGNGINLRHLGKNLGVDRRQFDIESIRNSLEDFQKLIQYLRQQKLKEKHEQKHIDTKKLTYEPKERQGIYVNLAGARLNLVVRKAIETSGFDVSPDTDFTCNLLWTDTLISMDIVSALKPYQKVNHFPHMNEIARKDLLVKNYTKLANLFPKEYNFIPKTWILPEEYNSWYSYASTKPKKDPMSYILKPFDASMGQGIAIHYDHKQIRPLDNYIIQEYIREPYLIDGFKFDVRIYVLITSCDPLRVFIYKNGIIQMCSKQYDLPTPTNVLDLSMHLTNYSIDDENNLDIENGKKQPLKFLFKYLKKQEQDDNKLWREIENIVLKTIFLAEPSLLTAYRTCRPGSVPISASVCFEVLGFDILIDKNLKPWLIEVNHCPNFDADEQIEYNIKTKLLFDTFHLLNFQRSDRKKSLTLEKLEEQQQLYVNLGRQTNKQKRELDELKENLYLLRREKGREQFENDHLGDYVRLLPINDQRRMDELIDLLTKSFEILSRNKTDTTWTMKYFHRVNERDLLNKILQLEKPVETDQQTNAKLTYTSKKHLGNNRELSSIGHSFETSDDEKRARSQSPRSERMKKSPSPTTDPYMKRASTQTPSDITRSVSLSTKTISKKRSNPSISTGDVTRPRAESQKAPPGVSANRITEKKAYTTEPPPSEHINQNPSHPQKRRKSNDKTQLVTYSAIMRANRQQQQQLIEQTTNRDMAKELHLNNNDFQHLHQLIFEQMNKLCIHYPNKSDKETFRICSQIIENWNEYKTDLARFWLVELDTDKRQSVMDIVWNNIQQIMKKICIVDELIQQLPLNRQLIKLKRRLLSNHGQPFWDACQDKHNSWESLFLKSTNSLSPIELDCCYCFVDLCKEALFIVYRYSFDEKIQKQKQTNHPLSITVKS